MGLIDIALIQKLKVTSKLTPKILLGTNLLFVPLNELTAECQNMLGDNPFFYFTPPDWLNSSFDIDTIDADSMAAKINIEEHLSLQISTCPEFVGLSGTVLSPVFWCSLLDTKGYLNTSVEEIADMLGTTEENAAGYIRAIASYVDPPGLFAADLTDCLLIQLERYDLKNSLSWELLAHGSEYILSNRMAEFGEKNGWSSADIKEAMSILKKLDPSPGKNFSTSRNIVPEIEFIQRDNMFTPRIMTENVPSIENSLTDFPMTIQDLISQKWMAPVWSRTKFTLVRLGMRYKTLIRISMYISEIQYKYMSGEKNTVDPLTYESAARKTGLSTSTVFRSINNTWCLVSGKVLPMKSFFSRGLKSRSDISVIELKRLIKTLNGEGCSDRIIAEKLLMPKRTVAYHRKKLGLLPVRSSKNNRSK